MYEARVKRGAELLDRFRPGWANQLSTSNIYMETCHECILGHLYGGYWIGGRILASRLPSDFLFNSAEHGFTLYDYEQRDPDAMAAFGLLAEAWRQEIKRRVTQP